MSIIYFVIKFCALFLMLVLYTFAAEIVQNTSELKTNKGSVSEKDNKEVNEFIKDIKTKEQISANNGKEKHDDIADGIYHNKKKKRAKHTIKPRSMGTDDRFKVFPYTDNGVYEVIILYDNPTFIEFDSGETINTIINPKRNAWQLVPTGNRLFIKPLDSDADTELTIMTTKHQYFFELYAKEPTEDFDDDYAFYFKFMYPNDEETKSMKKYSQSIMPDIDRHPELYNFNYTVIGEKSIYPLKIFDDNEFTYFEFPKYSAIPAIFAVDSSGFESIVNFRVVGPYIAVEEISPRFTMRNGSDIVCVFDEDFFSLDKEGNRSENRLDYNKKQKGITPGIIDAEQSDNIVYKSK